MTRRTVATWVVCVMLGVTTPLIAIYVQMETAQVPLARLASNLERDLLSDPDNVEKTINLARLYAMAFATKSADLPAVRLKPDSAETPWYGYTETRVPATVAKPASPADTARAQQNLHKAIAYYEAALALDPQNLTAGLGYGWTLEQSGDKTRATTEYRRVIEQAWITEQKASRGMLGRRFYTEEAAGYLIPLLDPQADAAEIADLQARRERLRAMPRPITPIAIPLRDDLALPSILDPLARVRFDADGSGLARDWTWITPEAGWLVYDARDKGEITSALQWFGNVSFWLFWNNGYDALGALDDNGDGELAGGELHHLAVWHDRNRDGVSDVGEVQPLSAHGIVALSPRHVPGDGTAVAATAPRGVRMSDGHWRATYDVILHERASMLTRR